MSIRLFVGNLAYDTTDAELAEFLSPIGKPLSVRILTDRETGKPRGFGFVEFSDAAQADEAVRRFHQQLFKGRPLVINEARPRDDGAGPRATPSGQTGRAPATARPGQPTRTFGPDAAPRGARRRNGRGAKSERTSKRPIPERTGGQFFAGGVEDSPDDQAADDVTFWDRAAADDQDKA
jgi:RNA recognition motif-containing protein